MVGIQTKEFSSPGPVFLFAGILAASGIQVKTKKILPVHSGVAFGMVPRGRPGSAGVHGGAVFNAPSVSVAFWLHSPRICVYLLVRQ